MWLRGLMKERNSRRFLPARIIHLSCYGVSAIAEMRRKSEEYKAQERKSKLISKVRRASSTAVRRKRGEGNLRKLYPKKKRFLQSYSQETTEALCIQKIN